MALSNECSLAIRNEIKRDVPQAVLDALESQLRERANFLRNFDQTLTEGDAMVLAAKQLSARGEMKANVQAADRAARVTKRKEADDFINTSKLGPVKAIEALVVEVKAAAAGAARSAENLIYATRAKFKGGLDVDLRDAKLYPEIKRMDRQGEREVWREMSRLTGADQAETQNKVAASLAKVYSHWIGYARQQLVDAGAVIDSLQGYIVKQTHDQMKIMNAGFEAWRDFVAPRLSEETFADVGVAPKAREEFLRTVYNNLASGTHLKGGSDEWLKGAYAGGRANIARRAAEDRTLFFKNADGSFEYHERFGQGSIHDVVVATLEKSARDVALIKSLTSHPQSFLEGIYKDQIAKALERNDLKMVKDLQQKSALKYLKMLDGTSDVVGNATGAKVMRYTRGYETITKLVGGAVNQFSDVPTRARVIEDMLGSGFASAIGTSVSGIVEKIAKFGGEDLAMRRNLVRAGAVTDGFISSISNKFDASDKWNGRFAKAVDLSQKLNLQRPWTETLLDISTQDLMAGLGALREIKFAELPETARINFERHGVTEPIWDYARSHTVQDHAGRHFVIADAIQDASDDEVRAMMGKADANDSEIRKFKDQMEDPLRSWFTAGTRQSMTEIGARTRYLVTGGGQGPGTIGGEVARTFTQFMSFPVEYLYTHLIRELRQYGSVQYGGVAKMVAGLTIAGFLSNTVNDALHNKSLPDPKNAGDYAEIGFKALARGGALSFMGDVLFGNTSQNPAQAASKFFGPTASEVGTLIDFYQHARDKGLGIHDSNLSARSLKIISDHLPVVNMAILSGAYQSLILQHLMEQVNPGYTYRYNRRLAQENQHPLF
jgi:hypothetical protein